MVRNPEMARILEVYAMFCKLLFFKNLATVLLFLVCFNFNICQGIVVEKLMKFDVSHTHITG